LRHVALHSLERSMFSIYPVDSKLQAKIVYDANGRPT
jgi:hypothetical protein